MKIFKPLLSRRAWSFCVIALTLLASISWQISASRRNQSRGAVRRAVSTATGVLPGEFERQQALVLSWMDAADPNAYGTINPDLATAYGNLLTRIISATIGKTEIVVLVSGPRWQAQVVKRLRDAGIDHQQIRFIHHPCETCWVRDYGPFVVKGPHGDCRWLKTIYSPRGDHPANQLAAGSLAESLGFALTNVPLVLDGGNLLSNGGGLYITTSSFFKQNALYMNKDRESCLSELSEQFAAEQIVELDPLIGEITQHVDIFATFTAPDTIVIGEYSADVDPLNSAILNENAMKLQSVMTRHGPLKVVRIPMPPRTSKFWTTYTNVVYANGTLLVPTYPFPDSHGKRQAAFETYQKLLPGWEIVGIDCSVIAPIHGTLHCITLNIPRLNSVGNQPLKNGDSHVK